MSDSNQNMNLDEEISQLKNNIIFRHINSTPKTTTYLKKNKAQKDERYPYSVS